MISYPQVECCNEACGWKGHVGDCLCFKHDPLRKPHCPECQEVVEYDFVSPDEVGDRNA